MMILVLSLLWGIEGHCENVSIVIDPGHGGEAMGGNYEDRIERDINLITALAMKERLEKYEGVDVYITRDNNTDKEMTRKQRFDFAQSKSADFLISIHYNMSENHTLFGSEVWVASKGTNYVKGYAFATLEMDSFRDLGLFDRGIKNKLNKDKDGEYYGILKYAEDYGIPSVIVEHCHLDEDRDSAFWNEESYIKFGIIDADNMAKFFKLSSAKLGIDNSDFVNISVDEPQHRLDVDSTEPEICSIEKTNEDDSSVKVSIRASDSDTYIQYYQLSFDGGDTFGVLMPWTDRTSEYESINIDKEEYDIELKVRVYNQYEVSATAEEVIIIDRLVIPEVVEETEVETEYDVQTIETELSSKPELKESSISPLTVLLVTFGVLLITFNIIFAIALLAGSKRRKKIKNKPVKDEFDWDI